MGDVEAIRRAEYEKRHEELKEEVDKLEGVFGDVAEIKVTLAVISTKMDNINNRIEVINHNTTTLTERIGIVEGRLKTTNDYKDFVKKLATALSAAALFVFTILGILTFLGLHI